MDRNDLSAAIVTSAQLKKELEREKGKSKGGRFFIGIIVALIAIDAIIATLTTMFFPIMSIHGGSMSPTLEDGNLVIAVKTDDLERGDICAFYADNTILCKRIIAFGGEVVDIDENGVVYIDNVLLDEPYISSADFGNVDITFPYLVPEYTYFVMGDHRATSIDSRSTEIGCVSNGQIIGKVLFRFWPFDSIGTVK